MSKQTISCSRIPVDSTQRTDLEKFFGSSAFLLLKEVVAAHCIVAQVDSMNAALYPANEAAEEKRKAEQVKAADLNRVLDMLDELGGNDQKWFTVKLEHTNH